MSIIQSRQTQRATVLAALLLLIMTSPACTRVAAKAPLGKSTQLYDEGLTAFDQGDYEQAVASFTQAIQSDPTHAGAYYERANVYFILGDFKQAAADFSSAIEASYHPLSYAYAARGDVNTVLGNYQQSREDFGNAYAADSDFVEPYVQARVKTFSRVIELDPKRATGYYARGWAYYGLNESEAALADCTQAIEPGFDPLSRAYAECGLIRSASGEEAQAIGDFTQAIELDPQAADLYFNRGNAYIKLKHHAEAIADFRAAVKLDQDFALVHNNLCWYGSLLGEATEVLDSCERAVQLEPNVPAFRDSRGLARALTGDFEGAIEDFQFYVEAAKARGSPSAAEREAWIAELQARRNPFDEAKIEDLLNE